MMRSLLCSHSSNDRNLNIETPLLYRVPFVRSSPTQRHARAPHDCKARVDTSARVARTNADQIVESAEPAVAADKSAQSVTSHNLVAVEMCPVMPFSESSLATEPGVEIIGNADQAKLDWVQAQAILKNFRPRTRQRRLDFDARQAPALRET
jgi:hypothetical protein